MKTKLNKPFILVLLAAYLVALGIGVFTLYRSGAHSAGFSGADESSHFLNGFFFNDYLRSHLPSNPLAYAVKYYVHYPKLSIGHWPPAYYGFLGLIFFIVPATIANAFVINLFVSALPVVVVAGVLFRIAGWPIALAGAVLYSVCPLVVEGYSFFMLDQVLAGTVAAASVVWVLYARRQTWTRALSFAALFTIAVLIKGNGWLLVFVPPYYLLLTRSWHVLRRPALYVSLACSAAVVLPWYWVTSGIAADGFNYHAGLAYAALALTENLKTGAQNLTWLFAPVAAAGVMWMAGMAKRDPAFRDISAGCLAVILATLTLQSLVPVDIVNRYMAPALPAIVILAMAGIASLLSARFRAGLLLAALASAVMILPGLFYLSALPPKSGLREAAVASTIVDGGKARIYLIDGIAGAEGGYIAELASKDPGLKNYALRSSKVFADSNFMGSVYQLKFSNKEAVLAELERLGISHVVVVKLDGDYAFPHSRQLVGALELPGSHYRKISSLAHTGRPGTTDVYASITDVKPNFAAADALGVPSKAKVITTHLN